MTRLSVALDATVLAELMLLRAHSGIGRAVTEIITKLQWDERIELTLSGACSPDPAGTPLALADLRAQRNWPVPVDDPHHRRLPVALHTRVYNGYRRRGAEQAPSAMALRAAWKMLKVVDTTPRPAPRRSIFHSSFLPLAPPQHTGGGRRLLSIWDLIPLSDPETGAVPALLAQSRALLASLTPSDHIVVNSRHVAQDVVRHVDVDPASVHVVHLAADPSFGRAADRDIATARAFVGVIGPRYILAVASVQPRKNLPLLIRAFGLLARTLGDDETELVILGQDWVDPRSTRTSLRDHADLAGRIHRIERIPEAHIAGLYAGAAAFVFPSRFEGFGLPLVEALAAGAPILAANASTAPEILGGAGVLVEPDDHVTLARELKRVLEDDPWRATLSGRSLERAKAFSWERSASTLADVYLEVANDSPQGVGLVR